MAKAVRKRFYDFPCIIFKQGQNELVFFTATAKTMWNLLSINQRIEDKDEGYQRALSQSRVNSISKYLDNGNPIPQSLLITLDEAEIVTKNGIKHIRIPNNRDAGWVIDGQHRFAGANNAKTDKEMPFIALIGIDVAAQIKLFVTINQEAKGVPSSLYYDLLKNLPKKSPQDQAKERAADIGSFIKKDEISPFYGRIVVTTAPKKGEISLTNFVRKITPLILPGKGILAPYTELEQRAIIDNYYKALKNIFPKEFNKENSIFFQTLGFGALFNALPIFFPICLRDEGGFTVANASAIFKKIQYFDFSIWNNVGTGSAAEIQAGQDLIYELNSMSDVGIEGSIKLV